MANPVRPAFEDVIQESWGDAVADTVVRRYATVAERDADLAGFTAAQLKGQVCTVATPLVLVYVHDGARWVGQERLIDRVAITGTGLSVTIGAAASGASGLCPPGFAWRLEVFGQAGGTGASGLMTMDLRRTVPTPVTTLQEIKLNLGGNGWANFFAGSGVDVPSTSADTALPTFEFRNVSNATVPISFGWAWLSLYALGPIPVVAQSLLREDLADELAELPTGETRPELEG